MAQNTSIEWADHTVNLWWGCSKVHAGCKNCYAESLANRYGKEVWGEKAGRMQIKSAFTDLAKYQKQAAKEGKPAKVFCGSMMDIFEDDKPVLGEIHPNTGTAFLRNLLFARIRMGFYADLRFLFLTKRPENIKLPDDFSADFITEGIGKPTLWFGTSVSNQETANKYVPLLVKNAPYDRFLSIEPQIGPIENLDLTGIGWVIQGGESGSGKRPFDLDWAYSMKEQCEKAGVPYFFKQWDKIKDKAGLVPEDLVLAKELPEGLR